MIQTIEVEKLNKRFDYKLPNTQESFNHGLNIFTGANGTGKTTLLKLIWFLTSGNLERIIPDIPFQYIKIQTTQFWLSMERVSDKENIKFDWEFDDMEIEEKEKTGSVSAGLKHTHQEFTELEYLDDIHKLNRNIAHAMKTSLFIPTFRRLEGGFTSGHKSISLINRSDSIGRLLRERTTDILQDALSDFSNSLSFENHTFVTSFSTRDIVELLNQEDSKLSIEINDHQSETLDDITRAIDTYSDAEMESETEKQANATSVLNHIQEKIKSTSRKLVDLRERFTVLDEIVDVLYGQYGGIQITENLKLGTCSEKEIIPSDKLSSGEKQFLGLLCYNAFNENTTIFIDEPELSLHVDWQRLLLPTLLKQGTSNQFFIVTHSPFIYTDYPQNEIRLDADRGYSQGEVNANNESY